MGGGIRNIFRPCDRRTGDQEYQKEADDCFHYVFSFSHSARRVRRDLFQLAADTLRPAQTFPETEHFVILSFVTFKEFFL